MEMDGAGQGSRRTSRGRKEKSQEGREEGGVKERKKESTKGKGGCPSHRNRYMGGVRERPNRLQRDLEGNITFEGISSCWDTQVHVDGRRSRTGG